MRQWEDEGRGFGGSWVVCRSGRWEVFSGKDEENFTEDLFEFGDARIVGGDERAGVGIMGGLSGLDGMREGTENLLGNEGRGMTSVEEGLGEVRGVAVEVIWTADAPPQDDQRVGNGGFGG